MYKIVSQLSQSNSMRGKWHNGVWQSHNHGNGIDGIETAETMQAAQEIASEWLQKEGY